MDVGVVALAEALLKAPKTNLTILYLNDVGMGDKGISLLAALVSQGRFEHLEELFLSNGGGHQPGHDCLGASDQCARVASVEHL